MAGARSTSVGAPRSEEAVQATTRRPIFFNALTEQQRDACIRRMAVVTHSKGEEIVTQGALGTSMYFMDTGMAVATVSGRQVSTFMPGDFFGEQVFIATVGHLLDAILAEQEDDRRAARARADTADRSDDAEFDAALPFAPHKPVAVSNSASRTSCPSWMAITSRSKALLACS